MKTAIRNRAVTWLTALTIGSVIGVVQPHEVASAARAIQSPTKYVLAAEGNEARYSVREQLAGRDLENDAVGVTMDVTGMVMVDAAGRIVRDSSRFVVDLATLRTDSDRRDGYVRRNTLEVEKYPTAVFVPFELRGLANGLPASGSHDFQVVGSLTLHGVSRLTTWNVTAAATPGRYTGTAMTTFRFADFDIARPRVPIVLSVRDSITLELDFNLIQSK